MYCVQFHLYAYVIDVLIYKIWLECVSWHIRISASQP